MASKNKDCVRKSLTIFGFWFGLGWCLFPNVDLMMLQDQPSPIVHRIVDYLDAISVVTFGGLNRWAWEMVFGHEDGPRIWTWRVKDLWHDKAYVHKRFREAVPSARAYFGSVRDAKRIRFEGVEELASLDFHLRFKSLMIGIIGRVQTPAGSWLYRRFEMDHTCPRYPTPERLKNNPFAIGPARDPIDRFEQSHGDLFGVPVRWKFVEGTVLQEKLHKVRGGIHTITTKERFLQLVDSTDIPNNLFMSSLLQQNFVNETSESRRTSATDQQYQEQQRCRAQFILICNLALLRIRRCKDNWAWVLEDEHVKYETCSKYTVNSFDFPRRFGEVPFHQD